MAYAVRNLVCTMLSIAPLSERRSALRRALEECVGGYLHPADNKWSGFIHSVGASTRPDAVDPRTGEPVDSRHAVNVRLARELLFWVNAMDQQECFDVFGGPRDLGWCGYGGVEVRVTLDAEDVLRAMWAAVLWFGRGAMSHEDLRATYGEHVAYACAAATEIKPSRPYAASYPLRVVDGAVRDALGRCTDQEVCAMLGDGPVVAPFVSFDESTGPSRAFWLEFRVSASGKPAFVAHAFARGSALLSDVFGGAP